jgi:hypothetical protein
MYLFDAGLRAGVIPADSPIPDWYSPQLATHSSEERLIKNLIDYGCHEITESKIKPGDIVVFRAGKAHGHAAIIVDWPEKIVHVLPPHGCQMGHAFQGKLGQYHKRYFSWWKGYV